MHVVEKCLEFTEREGWRSGGKCASSVPLQFLRRCKRDRESTERHQKSVPVDNRSAEGYGGYRACSLPALSGLLN
jgi:hypothetical protein